VTIKTQVRDTAAVAAACRRLALPRPVHGTADLYSGQATGLLVQLPGWLYPAVVETATGTVRYDNYNGAWGDENHLHRFIQAYVIEQTRIEARKKSYMTTEQSLADGPILVDIEVRGGRMKKIIRLIVSPTGEARIETRGFLGPECREASRFLEQALGQPLAEQLTAEFYQGQTTGQQIQQSQ
jgi:hypothetical protein